MPWGDAEWGDPWLPLGANTRTVAEQRDDPDSVLSFTRRLIALRRAREELQHGAYQRLEAPAGVWAWKRGDGIAVAVNLTDRPAQAPVEGSVLLATDGSEDAGVLAPWAGMVLDV
jgi:glycosidase